MGKSDLIKYAMIAGGAYLAYWYITNNGPQGAVYNAAGNKIAPSYWDSWFGSATIPAPSTGPLITGNTSTTPSTNTGTTANPPAITNTSAGTGTHTNVVQVMATPDQIAQIKALIKDADQAAFTALIPTLTYDKAAAMLFTAQNCGATGYNSSTNACNPAPARAPGDNPTPVMPQSNTTAGALTQASGSNSQNADQWNYYYTQLSGVPQTTDLFPVGNRSALMSVQQYLQARQAAGLEIGLGGKMANSGMQSLMGMGQIMPLAPNISGAYNGVRNPGMGDITPTPSVMPSTGGNGMGAMANVPKKSSWGWLPTASGYIN